MTKPGEATERCVMVVDDDNTILEMLRVSLGRHYRVVATSNGDGVAEMIAGCDPSLLLLDINLPGSDGFEICAKIRAVAEDRNLPVLFMTVRKDEKSFLKSLDGNGNAYITKPFEISQLKSKIRILLGD